MKKITTPLTEAYGQQKRWVSYRLVKVKDTDKFTKVPKKILGGNASSTDPTHWSTFAEVEEFSKQFGIIFTPEKTLLGVDLDHILEGDKITDATSKLFLEKANSYTEISPSKTGLHTFLALTEPLSLTAKKHGPYECYTEGRFFTVTNQSFHAKPLPVRTVTPAEAIALLELLGYPWAKSTQEDVSHEKVKSDKLSQTTPGQQLTDDQVLAAMFAAKNGDKIRSLYEGSANTRSASEADASLCSHLAFYTQGDKGQIERLWLGSPLAENRAKKYKLKRPDYLQNTINLAVSGIKEFYKPPRQKSAKDKELSDIFLTEVVGGKEKYEVVLYCQENVLRALRLTPNVMGLYRFDDWKQRREVFDAGIWRALEDNDYNRVQSILANSWEHKALRTASGNFVKNALIQYCEENKVDTAKDYLQALVWDKQPRLNGWLTSTFNTESNPYYEAVGSNTLKGMVKRIMIPGSKFDTVMVLEGKQGIGKSTALEILGGEWHTPLTTTPDNKDFFMALQGHAIVEFSEGETLSRTEIKQLKSIISQLEDVYRSPYDREIKKHPRRCIFAMSTNQSEYLKDETGNRRWLPVECVGQVNLAWLRDNRDQLLAEAYHRVMVLGENTYEGFNTQEADDMRESRRITRPEEEMILDWYSGLNEAQRGIGVSAQQAFHGAIAKNQSWERMKPTDASIIAAIFKNVLYLELTRKRKDDGTNPRLYYPSAKTTELVPVLEF